MNLNGFKLKERLNRYDNNGGKLEMNCGIF